MTKGIVEIHGRDYKTVALRVDEFRKKYSIKDGWSITTNIAANDGNIIIVNATISNPEGKTVATGLAEERRNATQINRTSALENCETSAIGRALAAAGFGGTEYASANEVENAVHQQTEQDAQGETEDAQPPSEKMSAQLRFEAAVDALCNRGAAATNDEWCADFYQQLLETHNAKSAGDLTTRAKQTKFYKELEMWVSDAEHSNA